MIAVVVVVVGVGFCNIAKVQPKNLFYDAPQSDNVYINLKNCKWYSFLLSKLISWIVAVGVLAIAAYLWKYKWNNVLMHSEDKKMIEK